ncbi:MAG: glycosyltransferase [Chitinispirillaceae bacterium]|nr:glycosyltransferase [Chitinispirillaceae bacterium]
MLFFITVTTALLLWWCGTWLLWRIPHCSGQRGDQASEAVTVIIPARNEAHNLPKLLQSLKPQLAEYDEIIVVDDHSTDRTADVAYDGGATVLRSAARPEGWTGKTWACWQGAQAARNERLLFIDADTWFADGALGRMISTLQRKGGLVSVQPFHCMRNPYERLSLLFNIMVMIGVDAFSLRSGHRAPAGSFGPCILCNRTDYFRVGGHEAVRATVLENLALGPLFLKAGITVSCFGGRGTLFYRMYPKGLRELVEGWTKGFATGAAQTPPITMALTVGWISGAFMATITPVYFLIVPSGGILRIAVSGVFALYCGQTFWMARRIGNFGIMACALLPVHLLFFSWIYLRSFVAIFIRKKVTWKGRDVPV